MWPGSDGCFIATAAYGSYEHDYLYVLRDFRDDVLSSISGQWFVQQYYQHSPPFARWLGDQAWARSIVRVALLPVIGTAWFLQQTGDIQALLFMLGLIVVAGIQKGLMIGLVNPLKSGLWLLLAGCLISLSLVSTGAKAEDLYFIHNDHLGTAQVITDKDQTVVWQGDYQPFGEVEETTAVIENPTRFPGQYFDQETGLHYNWMRDYDPVLGRYLQSDAIGLIDGSNTYGYALGNPLTYYDPNGENALAIPVIFILAGLVLACPPYSDCWDNIAELGLRILLAVGAGGNIIPFPGVGQGDGSDKGDCDCDELLRDLESTQDDMDLGYIENSLTSQAAFNGAVDVFEAVCPQYIGRIERFDLS